MYIHMNKYTKQYYNMHLYWHYPLKLDRYRKYAHVLLLLVSRRGDSISSIYENVGLFPLTSFLSTNTMYKGL